MHSSLSLHVVFHSKEQSTTRCNVSIILPKLHDISDSLLSILYIYIYRYIYIYIYIYTHTCQRYIYNETSSIMDNIPRKWYMCVKKKEIIDLLYHTLYMHKPTLREIHNIIMKYQRLCRNENECQQFIQECDYTQGVRDTRIRDISIYTFPWTTFLCLWKGLRTLNIRSTNIHTIKYLHVTSLSRLNCSNNRLTELNGIEHLTNLTILDASHNRLKRMPVLPKNITHLNLSYNLIRGNIVIKSRKIIHLNVSWNLIYNFSICIPYCRTLLVYENYRMILRIIADTDNYHAFRYINALHIHDIDKCQVYKQSPFLCVFYSNPSLHEQYLNLYS